MTVTEGVDPAATVSRLREFYDGGRTRPLGWRRAQLAALSRMLTERSAELDEALRQDLGKSATEAQLTEVRMVVAEANYLARRLRRLLRPRRRRLPLSLWPARGWSVREPLGVVLVVSPWNYPVQLALTPLAGAIASGNTVLLKPSELAPATSATLARLLPEYLDPGAVAVVEGGADEASQLLAQRFDHIFYTGSARVGRIVAEAAARQLTPVTLELGGKSPAWVDRTVDVRAAADRIVWGKFLNAGQTCVSPDYVLVADSDADALIAALRQSIRRFYGDDPATSPDYGRILSTAHLDRLVAMLAPDSPAAESASAETAAAETAAAETAASSGAGTVVIGGQFDRARRYLAPTVVDQVTLDHAVMQEEIFGPILPILRVPDADAAIEVVRSGAKPLALYVFTRSSAVRRAFVQRTSSGALGVNVPVAHLAAADLPFGGVGHSGIGNYHGEHSIRTFTHERAVLSKPLNPDTMRMVYPPHGRMAKLVARWLMR